MTVSKRITALVLTLALVFTALPAIGADLTLPVAAASTATVTVNLPANATVRLDGTTGTNQNGVATFQKAPGSYSFSVTRSGYAPISSTLTVTGDCTVDCNMIAQTSDILSGATVTGYSASGYYGGSSSPEKAYNGNFGDGWQSADRNEGDYLQVMFNGTKTLGSMTLYWERGSRPHKSNDGYTVQYTTDGTTFETYSGTTYEYAKDTSRGGIDGDVVTFGGVTCTGVRIVVCGYETMYSPKLYEIAASGVTASTFTVTNEGAPAVISSVAAQLSQPGGDKLRLFAAVDSLNYRNAGFEVTVAGDETTTEHSDKKVYASSHALSSGRFGIDNGYLFSLVVTDLPSTFSLRVTPFITTVDGARIEGTMTTVARGRDGLTVRPTDAYYVEEGWQLARVPDVSQNGATISRTNFSGGSAWINAVVPGTVLTSYYEAGLIEDPNFDDNILDLDQNYYNVDYWYRTTFTAPSDLSGRIWLNLDGINWKARIYLNGTELGTQNGAFIRGCFDVTNILNVGGRNALAVYLYWCEGEVADMPSFLCTKSWDFMPAIPGRDVGVYKDVYLTTSGDVTLRDAYVQTDLPLPDTSKATATASTFVKNNGSSSVTGTLTGVIRRDDGTGPAYSVKKTVTLAAGAEKEITFDPFTMQNPDLWWPNGAGDQPLYKMTLSFEKNGVVTDTSETTFGVREYTYRYRRGDLIVLINGERVLVRGGNWAVPDNLLDFSDSDYKTAVRMHRDMGFNMIRNWHGANDFEPFYRYCDEYGILVFEDFWLNGYEVPDDVEMFMANVEDKVRRLRSHACLCLWCGENETKPWDPPGVRMPETIGELDHEQRLYIAASNAGAVSGGISYQLETPKWYFDNASKFCTELGITTIPTFYSVQRMVAGNNQSIDSVSWYNRAWDNHGWNEGIGNKGVWLYKDAVTDRYGGTSSFRTFCDICQLINYESYRAMFEAWNDGMYDRTQGMLLWMSHPTWGCVLWQVYDAYQAQTGGYYGSKLACEDVHVQWNASSNAIKVANTTHSAVSGTVNAKIYNLDGTLKYNQSYNVTAAANAATSVANKATVSSVSDVYFLALTFTDSTGAVRSRNFYWIDKNGGTNYTSMKNMSRASVTTETAVENRIDGTTAMTVTLHNTSSVCAVAVDLTMRKSAYAAGEDPRVLPAWYEDNYFSLTPGETRTITITCDTGDLNGASPVLEIGGFNVERAVVVPSGGQTGPVSDIAASGTAFDCGVPVYDGVNVATNINDGNTDTGYQPAEFHAGDYVGLTFPSAHAISSLVLTWEKSEYIASYAEGGFRVSFRVNGNWQETAGITSGRSGTVDTLTLPSPITADGVRIEFMSQPDSKYPPQLRELQVYAS